MKTIQFVLYVLLMINLVMGQVVSSLKIGMQSPTAASLGKFGEFPVTLYSGTPDINIPLLVFESRDLSLPIKLDYHASGIKVEEIAGWVGLGWALDAGGIITRTVRGIPDDEYGRGYYYTGGELDDGTGNWSNLPPIEYITDLRDEIKDSEPDIFYINFSGRTGKFILDPNRNGVCNIRTIPHEKLNIQFIPNPPSGQSKWIIITEDGTKYTFDSREWTTNQSTTTTITGSVPYTYVSSWYLTKIESPIGNDFIELDYTDPPHIITHNTRMYAEKSLTLSSEGICFDSTPLVKIENKYTTESRNLYSIKSTKMELEFITSFREDALTETYNQQEYKLDKILIKNSHGTPIYEYEFNYGYFNYDKNGYEYKRLRLDSISKKAADGQLQPPYKFTYNTSVALPSLFSSGIDHWGYYNGKNNNPDDLIPEFFDDSNNINLPGANREPDSNNMTCGILKKIEYPTGGMSEFIYEPHMYGWIENNPNLLGSEYLSSIESIAACGDEINMTPLFQIESETENVVAEIDIQFSKFNIGTPIEFATYVGIRDAQNNPVILWPFSAFGEGTHHVTILLNSNQEYKLVASAEGTCESGGSFTDSYIGISVKKYNLVKSKVAGGVRIKKIITYDGMDEANTIIKEYQYKWFSEDEDRSSGVLVSEPIYHYYDTWNSFGLCECNYRYYLSRSSMNRMPLGLSQGNYIGYREVKELIGENGQEGHSIHYFRTAYEVQDESMPENTWPFGLKTSYDWMRGQCTSIEFYNSESILQKKMDFDYTFSTNFQTTKNYRGLTYKYLEEETSCPGYVWVKYPFIHMYSHISAWYYLNKKTVSLYDQNGENPINIQEKYYYDDPSHIQLTRVEETSSTGLNRVREYKYAHEIADYSDMASDGIHMISQKCQETIYEGSINVANARSSTATTYDDSWFSGKWAAKTTYNWRENDATNSLPTFPSGSVDNEWIPVINILSRDNYGNILEYEDAYGTPTAVKWGYNNTLPVASVQNAEHEEIVVENFENDGFNIYRKENYESHTGSSSTRACFLDWNNNATINLEGGQRYCISYWTKKGTASTNPADNEYTRVAVSGGLLNVTAYPPDNGEWLFVSQEFDVSETEAGNHIIYILVKGGTESANLSKYHYLDDLRIYPLNALCTSKSYDPATLKTSSVTDANNVSTYYTYDNFGRLATVANHENQLLSEYRYFYSRDGNAQDEYDIDNPNYVQTNLYYIKTNYFDDYENDFSDIGTASDWQAINGSWAITGGVLRQSLNTGNCYYLLKTPYDDIDNFNLSFKMKSTDDDRIGIVYNYQDANNYYRFIMHKQTPQTYIQRIKNGVGTTLDILSEPYTYNQWHDIRITRHNLCTEVYVDGEKKLSAVESEGEALGAGQIGFYNHYNSYSYYDNLVLTCPVTKSISYVDGIGRNIQNQVQQGNEDIISGTDFDAFNRPVKLWKPINANTGHTYASGYTLPDNSESCLEYYLGSNGRPDCGYYPYTETVYRNAFSEEPSKIGYPGSQFRIKDTDPHHPRFSYHKNDASDGLGSGEYYEVRIYDENNTMNESYTDIFGNNRATISNRTSASGDDVNITTQFEYDILGNMVKVIPPKAFTSSSWTISKVFGWENYCTYMKYNTLGQMIEKATPDLDRDGDGDPTDETTSYPDIKYRYDLNGNLRFVSDPNGINDLDTYCIYYKYDKLNRLIEEGTALGSEFVSWDGEDPDEPNGIDVTAFKNFTYDTPTYTGAHSQRNLKGRLSKVDYLDQATGNYGITYYSYDEYGNVEWIIQDLPGEEIDEKIIEYDYDLQGKVTQIRYNPGGIDAFFFWYDYDQLGQLAKVHSSTNATKPTYADAVYDYWPTGQVKTLTLNEEGPAEVLNYEYTPRDWLDNINAPGTALDPTAVNENFAMKLYYNNPSNLYNGTVQKQYNGNISEVRYHVNNPQLASAGPLGKENGYIFEYDDLSRLTSADYVFSVTSFWVKGGEFSVNNLDYDAMGNILNLTRKDENGSGSQFTYNYQSGTNKLLGVSNLHSLPTSNFTYDENGNIKGDASKLDAGGQVYYDYRNLPLKVLDGSGGIVTYVYDQNGTRISKQYTIGGTVENAQYYIQDASGRTMAVYDNNGDLLFINLYGLDLIGKVY